jgi:hypothetical protein
MATVLKTAGLCFAAWLVPLAVSFLVVVIAAGATEHWGAARAQWIVGVVLLTELALFAVASVLLWWGLSSFITATSTRALVFGLHALLQLATFAILAFSTLVAFNR